MFILASDGIIYLKCLYQKKKTFEIYNIRCQIANLERKELLCCP